MKTNLKKQQGFTLVEIMIVVAIIGLLAAIAIPNFVRARNQAQKNTCINNLRQIDGAKQQYALENRKVDSYVCTTDNVDDYLKNNQFPTCPASGSYGIGAVNTDPTCSLSNSPSLHILPSA
jgi:prepilin-type N-terminal cleavage/methylation domain-containing protein